MFMFKLVWMSFLGTLEYLKSLAVRPLDLTNPGSSLCGTQLLWISVRSFSSPTSFLFSPTIVEMFITLSSRLGLNWPAEFLVLLNSEVVCWKVSVRTGGTKEF